MSTAGGCTSLPQRYRPSATSTTGSGSPSTTTSKPKRQGELQVASLLRRRSNQSGERCQGGLGRVQAEPEVLVVVGGVQVGRLMPVRIPARPDLGPALVFAQTDRRHEILEWRRVGVGHVWADGCRIVGRVLLVGCLKRPRQLLGLGREFGARLELDVHIGFGRLLGGERPIGARHPLL